jgi:hypothetical protein
MGDARIAGGTLSVGERETVGGMISTGSTVHARRAGIVGGTKSQCG